MKLKIRLDQIPAWAALTVLTLFALALRLFRLDFRSIWLDEAYSLRLAAADWHGILRAAAADIHPPLFHLLLAGWVRVFGTGEFAARSLSAVLGAGLVPAVFGLARSLAGNAPLGNNPTDAPPSGTGLGAAWWAAGITAVSPYLMELSRSARMGSLLALTSVLSVYFFLQVIRDRHGIFAFGYFFSSLAALYTHYFAALVIFAQGLYLFMGLRQLRLPRRVRQRWLYLQFALLGGFAPWLPELLNHLLKGGPSWRGVGAAWWEPAHSLYAFFLGTACWRAADKVAAVLPLAGAIGIWLGYAFPPRGKRIWDALAPRDWGLLASLTVVPLLLVLLYSRHRLNVFDNRYLSLSAVMVFIGLGAGWSRLPRPAGALAGLLLAAAFCVPLHNQYFVYGYYDNWRVAADRLLQDARPGDTVAVYPAWNEPPLQYYMRGRMPVQGLPGTYDPLTGEISDDFYIDRQSVHHLQSRFYSRARVWLVLVNEGGSQDAVRAWLSESFRLRQEQRLGSIWLGLWERP